MRRQSHHENEGSERWLISYADFITLLFAFFVVLYATSRGDAEKQKKFEESINKYLSKMGSTSGAGDRAQGVVMREASPEEELRESRALEERMMRYIEEKLSSEERKKLVQSITFEKRGVRLNLSAEAIFDSGKANLRPEILKSLDKLGLFIKKESGDIVIEGHTDNAPIESDIYPSNWELASHRATTVVRYFIKRFRIDPRRLSAVSFGEQRPWVKNQSPEEMSKNRRIEILLQYAGVVSQSEESFE